jgi:transcriptional regulator with XRE-family HTH domain
MNGKAIAILRYRLGLTQAQFAKKLGIGCSTLAKIEAGISPISTRVKTKILEHCEIDEKLLEIVNQMKLFDKEMNE